MALKVKNKLLDSFKIEKNALFSDSNDASRHLKGEVIEKKIRLLHHFIRL